MTSPAPNGCALFDTGIGSCGIAWKGGAIIGLQLPEPDPAHTLVRLQRHTGSLPQVPLTQAPVGVQQAAEGVQAIMRGEARDLCEVALDMQGVPEFQQRVFAIARARPAATATLPMSWAANTWPAPWGRRWGSTRLRPSCPATACWPPTASPGAFRVAAGH